MKTRLSFAVACACAGLVAGTASAQFKLYESPSAIRAANAAPSAGDAAKELAKRPGLHPLSPLGGPQGTPNQIQPAAPAGAMTSYTGTDKTPSVGLGTSLVGPANAKPEDPSVDDPNRPRQPLKPKTLSTGIAPR
jgi:hypothetical protein